MTIDPQDDRPALDAAACHRALAARDPRFDGRLFVGVRTTGVYCRPVCPARTPRLENCVFFASAAAAQRAGFRPCLRCRPETSPEVATWRGTASSVTRALALIADGALDGDDASVERLAARVGLGERQLRRLFRIHLGASPIAVAQTRRVLFAKQLVHETRMSMTEIALASGFGSVRRFNETFRALYGRPPRALRRGAVNGVTTDGGAAEHGARAASGALAGGIASSITLVLPYVAPYDWDAMLGFLTARAIPGVEQVSNGTYRRTIALDGAHGTIEVAPHAQRAALRVTIALPKIGTLWTIVGRVRRVFDLGADVAAIAAALARDPLLAPLVTGRPGLRVPGGWEPFELAVRAILGQQVSVRGARTLAGRLVELCGERRADASDDDPLRFVFPTPARIAVADLSALGVPRARAATIVGLARAVLDDPELLAPAPSLDDAVARLRTVPGVGEWTAQYVALRALREPDAFPASDLGLLRALADASGRRPTPAALLARAEAWRPWRAYAAQHLWTRDAAALMPARVKTMEDRHERKHAALAARHHRDADRRRRAAAGR